MITKDMLPIHEVVCSFSGEVGPQFAVGEKIIIVRLSGCNLTCPYCDTPDTQKLATDKRAVGCTIFEVSKIITDMVRRNDCYNVLITGGEPLLYAKQLNALLCMICGVYSENNKPEEALLDYRRARHIKWQIETNGSLTCEVNTMLWRLFEQTVKFVVDTKTHMLEDRDYLTSIKWWLNQAMYSHDRIYFKIPISETYDTDCQLVLINRKLEYLMKTVAPLEHPFGSAPTIMHFFFAPVFNDGRVSPSLIQTITKHIYENNIIKDGGSFIHLGINVQMHKMINVP